MYSRYRLDWSKYTASEDMVIKTQVCTSSIGGKRVANERRVINRCEVTDFKIRVGGETCTVEMNWTGGIYYR